MTIDREICCVGAIGSYDPIFLNMTKLHEIFFILNLFYRDFTQALLKFWMCVLNAHFNLF